MNHNSFSKATLSRLFGSFSFNMDRKTGSCWVVLSHFRGSFLDLALQEALHLFAVSSLKERLAFWGLALGICQKKKKTKRQSCS